MTLSTVVSIILASFGALILGMAALIKTMVVGKLEDLQSALDGMKSAVHHLDLRVTRLEAEHRLQACIYSRTTEE